MKENNTQCKKASEVYGGQDLEANLLAIIENTDDLIYSLDRDFRYITLNGAMKKKIKTLFAIDAKVGDRTYDFLMDIDHEATKYWQGVYTTALKGESLHFVKEFGYSGIQEFWNFSINPIRQGGEVTGLSCFAREVTELRKARLALEASEQKYRLMFNNNPLPSWIYDGVTLRFMDVNDAAIDHYGFSREEFLRMTIREIKPESDQIMITKMVNTRANMKAGGKTIKQHLKKSGEIIDVCVLSCPIEINNEINILVVAEDITEKKKAAANLRESEERYRLVSENPLLGIGWASLTGEILYLNQTFCNLLGYNMDELKSLHYSQITHPEDFEWETELFQKLTSGEIDNYKVEKRYIKKNGEYIWVELNLTRVNNTTGQKYCIGIIQDISQRKEAEDAIQKLNAGLEDMVQQRTEQLKAAYAELEAFSYSVSHDLRSPLRLINGFLKVLAHDLADRIKPNEREYIEIVNEKVLRMDVLIRDMLQLSTIDKSNLIRTEVDMHETVVGVLEELNFAIGGHNADINITELPRALCDHSMMKQVWANLIGNAIKYSGKKPNALIEIGATLINDQTTYYVKDNGAGFDMKKADKLFTAFQRLHDSRDFEGTGVGLALVNRIISKHSGKIWAEAKENEGATFYFCLS